MHKKLAVIGTFSLLMVAVGVWSYVYVAAAHEKPRALAMAPTPAPAAATVPQSPASAPAAPKTYRVLIVPGHEPDAGGARSGKVFERVLAAELGADLRQYLQTDAHFDVSITRDNNAWDPTFASYFSAHAADIAAWQKAAIQSMASRVAMGKITLPAVTVDHPAASTSAAAHLYGITKWANENGVDVMVHLHFNDDRMYRWSRATRSGFAIYEPVMEFQNGVASHTLASDVFTHLATFNPVSDLAEESKGIIDDSQLIALGEDDTAHAASILIEYDYIYERQYADPAVRSMALKDLAYQTFLGLQQYFGEDVTSELGTSVLPYTWKKTISGRNADSADVYALQTALILDGDFPGAGQKNNACRRNGLFGTCTRAALARFQKKYDISGEDGIAGTKTFEKLQTLWARK